MTHSPTCSGCPECDTEMRAAMRAFSAGDYEAYCRLLTMRAEMLRTAGGVHVQEDTMAHDYTPPDAYGPALAAMRAAEATPESRFAEQHKANRHRELAAEHRRHAACIEAAPQPRLTAAELAEFTPPDPYARDLAALKAKEQR